MSMRPGAAAARRQKRKPVTMKKSETGALPQSV
jgi:hypothetical protein